MNTNDAGCVLMVEDEEGFRRTFADFLEAEGYRVVRATDGEQGWRLARFIKPDLILLDIVLPKLSGYRVLKRIRADLTTNQIPVVMCSVLDHQQEKEQALGLGANDYIVKGSNSPAEILEKIRATIHHPHHAGATTTGGVL